MSHATEGSASELAFASFLKRYPSYAGTAALDGLRAREYDRLDRSRHIYLDYTGGSQYAASQLRAHFDLLKSSVFGNPHSTSSASLAATDWLAKAREQVLRFFHASPDEYFVVFTSNASGALKLVGESYPFEAGSRFLLTIDNHNSVNGIREFARARGAEVEYGPIRMPELRVDRAALSQQLGNARRDRPNLFAFPAQSNFSGVQHPLELIDEAHDAGWDVLLDAAAFTPTNRFDLSRCKPDFVALSFYKMFGYPTGAGCLLLRRTAFEKLRRPWFAGGAVRIASVLAEAVLRPHDEAAFEDGTVDYLNLPAVQIGLEHLEQVGIDRVHERVRCLTGFLLEGVEALKHSNGRPVVRVHGPTTLDDRGATVAFNVIDRNGVPLDIADVEERAGRAGISLRSGCFCNPGVGEVIYGLTAEQIEDLFREEGLTFDGMRARVREKWGQEVGATRASLGVATNFADVFRFLQFLQEFRDHDSAPGGRNS
ncbi:MAG TPA: aminotransferase class V-fold PLP-dependent enzyme [Candidatus Binatia bacterium]|nr:aminotransferase class V-fold PLP-dependent enzyme [Candidatus Binatia bacterium]